MVIVIKKGSSKKVLASIFKKASAKKNPTKALDAHKYCGTVKFKEDALVLQKNWRDEWR